MGILAEPSFSIDNACNAIYRKGRLHSKTERKNETEESGADDSDIMQDGYIVFNSISPKYPYLKEATIELTDYEAEYLKTRILHASGTKDSALAYMLRHPELIEKYKSFKDFCYTDFSEILSEKVRLAIEFADFIYGAHLLYNIIYADGCGHESSVVSSIKQEFDEYTQTYKAPSVEEIILKTKAKYNTAKFLRDFNDAMTIGDISKAQQIIIAREQDVKKRRSKLLRPSDYQYTEPIHYFRLSYRYDTARQIMLDIVNGMGGSYD